MMQDLATEKWEDFLKKYCWDRIIELSNYYPERRSLLVVFSDVDIYDPNLADTLLEDPDVTIESVTRALREIDIPTGVILDETNVRVIKLPKKVKIRDIRSNDIGKLVSIEGLVTKATEVRPRVIEAKFECPFCGHRFSLGQSGRQFREPMECEKESGGCGRKIQRFKLLVDQCKFVNAQKIRLQESPEDLRGGELPQSLDVNLEDDISGEISPGNRIVVVGILRSYQRTTQFGKTPFFDIYLDANSLEVKEEEFEEIEITDEDEREIMALKNQPGVYEKLIGSIAPSIYGYHEIKEAMVLQLFAGVPKDLPDGSRVRGDIHLLLVGDPGVAKCVSGNTEILLSDGSLQDIKSLVECETSKKPCGFVDDGIYVGTNHDLFSLDSCGKNALSKGNLLWKREATPKLYRILTSSGRMIEVTPTHPFFVCGEDAHLKKKKAEDMREGEFIATPREIDVFGTPQPININYRKSKSRNAVILRLPSHTTREFWRFIGLFIAEGYLESKMQNGYPQCTAFFANSDSVLLEEFQAFATKLGLNPSCRDKSESTKEVNISGIEFGAFLENLGAAGPSESKTVPELLFKCTKGEIAAFLSALFDGDGTVSEEDRKIAITSASRKLISQVQHLLLRFGIHSQRHPTLGKASNTPHPKEKAYYRLMITGADVLRFKSEIGFTVAEKRERVEKISVSSAIYNTNVDVVPNISSLLKEIRTKLRLSQFKCGIPRSSYQHYESGDRNPSRTALNTVVQEFEKKLAEVKREEKVEVVELVSVLKTIVNSDIFWDKVEKIEVFVSDDEFVYDIQVPVYHNFIANDIYVHNSQLLTYLVNLAPRGLYTGGKSSSAAGLTAAAVRDEFGEGRWTLEAGALVLADKGIAAVDEIDKMRKEDRDALHEAMEQQSFVPDFDLTLSNGEKKKIGSLVDGLMEQNSANLIKGVNCEILPLKENFGILTTDFNKIFEVRVDRVSRHLAPGYFMEISLQNGRAVKVTPEHPCWIVKNGKLTTIPAEEIGEGEFLPIPEELPINGATQSFDFPQTRRYYRKEIRIPMHNSPEFCRFLGYYLSDGSYELNRGTKNGINFWNSDPVLMEDYITVVKALFGVDPYIQKRENRTAARIISLQLVDFLRGIDPMLLMDGTKKRIPPMIMQCKKEDISQLLRGLFDGDGGFFLSQRNGVRIKLTTENREMAEQVQELLCRLGIRATIFDEKKNVYRVEITGHDNLSIFYQEIGFLSPKKHDRLERYLEIEKTYRTQVELVPDVKDRVLDIAKELKISLRERFGYSHDRAVKNMQKKNLGAYVTLFESKLSEIEQIISSINEEHRGMDLIKIRQDFGIARTEIAREMAVSSETIRNWENSKIKSIEQYRAALITLLTRMLRTEEYVSELHKLAFGKVSWCRVKSVRRIENEDIKWVYDVTVEPHHTFISNNMVFHNTVSIAKAGIMARLNSRCALLAAANPTGGRFNRYDPISKQINMPPTLVSRFDLIYTMMDQPDEERDTRTAEHILETHYAGELLARLDNVGKVDDVGVEQLSEQRQAMEPEVDAELFRKYVAWSKRNVYPVMTEEAKNKFLEFYIGLRRQGYEDEEAPVPITARQLEALIRLGEASARVELNDKITAKDAERVINVTTYCLKQVFVDPETGKLDTDWVTVGTTKTRRDRARSIQEIIRELENEYGEEVPLEEVLDLAEEEGMEREKAEDIIDVMKRDGILFSPGSGVIKFVR